MTLRPARIVISGPAGSGKTTLATALSARLGVPVIAEEMLPLYRARERYQAAAAEARPQALREWMESYLEWCIARDPLYRGAAIGFVADRWELDLVSMWLRTFVLYKPDAQTETLLNVLRMRCDDVDLAVLLPPATSPVEEDNGAGLRRPTDRTSHYLSYSLGLGLVQQLPPRIVRYTPAAVEPVDKRVADIISRLG
jgi:hypothetical protein